MWFSCSTRFRFSPFCSRFARSVFVISRSAMDKASLFQSIGLSEQKAKETVKNEVLSARLESIINLAKEKCVTDVEKSSGVLLYSLASSSVKEDWQLNLITEYITSSKVASSIQLTAAVDYMKANPVLPVDVASFEESCGVGVKITPDQVEDCVEELIKLHKEELLKKRYKFNVGMIMGKAREKLKWADGKAIKAEIDMQVLDLLGPKTEEDMQKQKAVKDPKPSKEGKATKEVSSAVVQPQVNGDAEDEEANSIFGEASKFHKPGENFKTPGYVVTPNTLKLMKEHLERTGGRKSIAEVYKDEGNDEYKRREFTNAVDFYSQGLQVNCKDDDLNAKLHSNRATAHFYLENYHDTISDAKAALHLKPNYIKAIERGMGFTSRLIEFLGSIPGIVGRTPDLQGPEYLRTFLSSIELDEYFMHFHGGFIKSHVAVQSNIHKICGLAPGLLRSSPFIVTRYRIIHEAVYAYGCKKLNGILRFFSNLQRRDFQNFDTLLGVGWKMAFTD
ncbi:glutamine--tRNA ligase-like [Montipora capricornis]|uniref:glutamine--tRNA ligase-like n=1 Tax=Montipora capricornis TaxID=246305 RepID=UPI0035F12423